MSGANVTSDTPVAVVGLGTMGHGIAQAFAVGGHPVRGFDEQPGPRATLYDRVAANLEQLAAAGLLDLADLPNVLGRISVCETLEEAVAGAGFVTEAAWEELEIKRALFGQLEELVSAETILASNSSSFTISETARDLAHPERAVVTHWFNPPHVIPVVEVVGGERTSKATVATTVDVLERIGKTAVRVDKELPGFLVNRVQVAMMREIWDLLDRGVATPEEIDRAIRGSMGLRLAARGPLEIVDYAGWDVTTATYANLVVDMRRDTEIPEVIRTQVENGDLGAKTGQGVFAYPAEELAERLARRDADYLALVRMLHPPDAGGDSA